MKLTKKETKKLDAMLRRPPKPSAQQVASHAQSAKEASRRIKGAVSAAKRRGPGRPPGKGPDSEPVLLKLSPSLLATVTTAAELAGVSRVEWLRRAAAYCVITKAPLAHLTVSE